MEQHKQIFLDFTKIFRKNEIFSTRKKRMFCGKNNQRLNKRHPDTDAARTSRFNTRLFFVSNREYIKYTMVTASSTQAITPIEKERI